MKKEQKAAFPFGRIPTDTAYSPLIPLLHNPMVVSNFQNQKNSAKFYSIYSDIDVFITIP